MRLILFFFFFSSRRRHTRFDCDWSSDVCSSDLVLRAECDVTRQMVVLVAELVVDHDQALGIVGQGQFPGHADRKSTRLNSSHSQISYAVFCLKKKKATA